MESTVVRDGETVLLMAASRLLAIARHDPGRTREKRGDFELLRVFPRPEVW
jgi:tRNA pseudouridine55 synthase